MLNIQQIKRKRINKNIKKQMLGDKESKVVIKKEIKKDYNKAKDEVKKQLD